MGFIILFSLALTWVLAAAANHDWRREDVEVLKQKRQALKQRIEMNKEHMRKERLKTKLVKYGPRKFKQMVEDGLIEVKPGDLD